MMMNVKKTSYMIFGRKGKCIDGNFTVKISNNIIDRVKYTKFLGVYFDEDLNWKHHTAQVSVKIAKSIGIMNKIRNSLSSSLLKILYFSLIQSHLGYCNIIWGVQVI